MGEQPPPDTGISRFALTFFPILHILNAIHSDEGKEYPRAWSREKPVWCKAFQGAGGRWSRSRGLNPWVGAAGIPPLPGP